MRGLETAMTPRSLPNDQRGPGSFSRGLALWLELLPPPRGLGRERRE